MKTIYLRRYSREGDFLFVEIVKNTWQAKQVLVDDEWYKKAMRIEAEYADLHAELNRLYMS